MSFDRTGFYREVALRLQLARKRDGRTQADVAEALGMPRASYANVERGRQRVPVDLLWRVAVVLGVPLTKLIPAPKREPVQAEAGGRLTELGTATVSFSVPAREGTAVLSDE